MIRKATSADIDGILRLIRARMDWMDAVGIRQWNFTRYLDRYPRPYFEARIGAFFVAEEKGVLTGAMALFEEDPRWDRPGTAYYLHHLVSAPDAKGTGAELVRFAEGYAKERGKEFLRLDSAVDNAPLARYYEAMGYPASGTCDDGAYHGLLREKRV